jgi:hypothetical protein
MTAAYVVFRGSDILQKVLDFVGPGEHAFVSTVSKSFRACYLQDSVYENACGDNVEFKLAYRNRTTCSSALRSLSRLRLAVNLGFPLDPQCQFLQNRAGRVADIETLVELHEQYHMPYTKEVSSGAAVSGLLCKLQWLLDEKQQCLQPDNLDCFAVQAPTLDVLKWLKQRGCVFTAGTCSAAAKSSRAASVLKYLHSEGAPFDAETMATAINFQELPLLQWLHDQGCPLSKEAAVAASKMKDLRALGWLHSIGCPCDFEDICFAGLLNGSTSLLQWVKDNDIVDWTATLLSECLNIAGACGYLDTAEVRESLICNCEFVTGKPLARAIIRQY